MPKNLVVKDIRPTGSADDIKSSFGVVLDTKSKNIIPINEEKTYYLDILAGMPMGLLLSLTYPTAALGGGAQRP